MLAIHIANYAKGAYEDFDGEPDVTVDAVDLTTVHQAKGLEWPVVFVPSLTARRYPSVKTGRAGDWRVPTDLFDAARYECCDADERRDWLTLQLGPRRPDHPRRDVITRGDLPLVIPGIDPVPA